VANRFFNPNEQFCDSAGQVYAGGTLDFYASGTSTRLNTYSDSALSIANTNPVVLDSAGRANSIFLQNLAYKVVLSQLNSDGVTFSQIWTEDPVYSSDYSTRAKLTSGSGSPNGSVAGTAGSAGIGADTYWDNVNNILYVCTQTGTTSTAVWTAVNATAAAAIVPAPQGYLTLTSGTPIIPSDVTAATAVIYTPYVGNLVPIYNGTGFSPTVFSELTLTLTASQAASTIYDVFVFNNTGVLTLVTGPAWATSTAGSGARGTGAGTTQISRLSGIWVNSVQMTGRNGSSTFTIPANQGTYLGSIFIDNAAGQVTCHVSYGQSRKWGVWNAYNRKRIIMKAGDGTANWNYSTNTVRAANGNSANSLTSLCGLPEEPIALLENQRVQPLSFNTGAGGNFSGNVSIGVGINSTTAMTGTLGNMFGNEANVVTIAMQTQSTIQANYTVGPGIGTNVITALEVTTAAAGVTPTYFGTESAMLLRAEYLG
jgi:hypothetical protein